MEIDEQVLEEVWKGAVPLRVSLAKLDVASNEMPSDYYTMISRGNYLPTIIETVKKHFELYVATDFSIDSIWFSYNSVPLKWHYPVGLLVDMNSSVKSGNLSLVLPFHIEVHFHRFPTEVLLPYQGLKSLRSIFQNNLKESSSLLLGTSAPVMNLSRDQEENMWKSLNECNFKQFKDIGSDFTRPEKTTCRYLPVKFLGNKAGMALHPILVNDSYSLETAVKSVFPDFEGCYLSQGILLPRESDLFWLWIHLSYPDNFLYIFLVD